MKKRCAWQLLLLCLALTGVTTGCAKKGQEILWTETESAQTEALQIEESERETEAPSYVYADICGAVKSPGVYRLQEGARVYELVNLAGGLTEDADRISLNQAVPVTDGMKVRVYTLAEAQEMTPAEDTAAAAEDPASQKININRADSAQLTQLSGIGESRAADIIAYRTEHGDFQKIEDIMNVAGIKEATFEKIKDRIVVE